MTTDLMTVEKRIDDLGWGIFLILLGTVWLVPGELVPHGTWLVAAGTLFLGLNFARHRSGLCINGCTTIIGVLALLAGFGDLMGITAPLFAVALIVTGAALVARPLIPRRG